jgi:putative FmdB family regulatory protein
VPVHEFACKACGARFEELVRAAGDDELSCPQCGSEAVERLFSSFATKWKPSNVNWHRMP